MKKLITYTLLTIALIWSCNSGSDKPKASEPLTDKIIGTYFNGLNESNFKKIASCISDSLLTMEGGFVLTKSSKDYYIHFQWDSVFSPTYQLLNSEKISDSSIVVTISKICDRIRYLHDTATVYKAKIDLTANRITKINNLELVVFDTLKWGTRRDALVAWIRTNHPELDGFIMDQTPAGAKHYLQAIELYTSRN
ncbi:MAG: hypothetical protein JW801_19315 [Bacteroidales bacterium]|nr:hypothetical protein [Bacteroidales bacterium]